jgi:hypothetical protein
MSNQNEFNTKVIELTHEELDAVVGGASSGDAAMAAITQSLEQLNKNMAQQQLQKAKTIMPSSTAKQAAGNASS